MMGLPASKGHFSYKLIAPKSPFVKLNEAKIEARTQEVGRAMLLEMERTQPSPFNRLKDFLIDFGTASDGRKAKILRVFLGLTPDTFKIKLLEFLVVVPSLKTSWHIFTKLLDIFKSNEQLKFLIIVSFIPFFTYLPFVPYTFYSLYRLFILFSIKFVATRFMVKKDPLELIKKVKKLKREGAVVTIDVLGEDITSKNESDEMVKVYVSLLETLHEAGTETPNVSVKLTGLSPNFSPLTEEGLAEAEENLKKILRVAIQVKGFVYIDMEEHKLKDATLKLYKKVLEDPEFKEFHHLGIVFQAYLKETKKDVESLLQWSREQNRTTPIRLVKGAYWDQEIKWAKEGGYAPPVIIGKHNTDANYEAIAQMLLTDIAQSQKQGQKPAILPAFATHSARTAAKVISMLEIFDIDRATKQKIEFQVLYGMGEKIRRAITKRGYQVRVYIPFGELIPGTAYLVRRIIENTTNEGFIAQSKGKLTSAKIKDLLRDPRRIPFVPDLTSISL